MKKKNFYMIVKYFFTPKKDSQNKEKLLNERVYFTDKLKNKDVAEASFIVDLINYKMIKNRYKHNRDTHIPDEEIIKNFVQIYQKELLLHAKEFGISIN